MPTSLSSHVDTLSEKLHSDKCKYCKSELHYMSVKYNQLIFQCLECQKNYNKYCNKELININIFILLLRKGVYPYKYMDSWERFNEASLPDKKAFYSELNLEDITDKDYTHAQNFFEELKLKNLVYYHDYHVCSN